MMSNAVEGVMKFASLLACVILAGCSSNSLESDSAGNFATNTVESCVHRGIAYFQKIGSYPALREPPNAGRAAAEVAQERCQRELTSF